MSNVRSSAEVGALAPALAEAHGRNWRRLPWARLAVAVVLLAALGVLSWLWRHPEAFHEAGGWGVRYDSQRVGEPVFVGMSYPAPDARGTVTIHGAEARIIEDSAGTVVEFLVCDVDRSAGFGAIGSVGEREIRRACSSLRPAEGATVQLEAIPLEQVVIAVTPTRPGTVTVRGMELIYSHGWQRGTQLIGGEIALTSTAGNRR